MPRARHFAKKRPPSSCGRRQYSRQLFLLFSNSGPVYHASVTWRRGTEVGASSAPILLGLLDLHPRIVAVQAVSAFLAPRQARDLEECEESELKKPRILDPGLSTGAELLPLLIAAIREAGLKRTLLVRVRATALSWRVHIDASVAHGSRASRCCSRSRLFNKSRLCCISRRSEIVTRISEAGPCRICGTRHCGIAVCATGHR
jgi:hypothetical protein